MVQNSLIRFKYWPTQCVCLLAALVLSLIWPQITIAQTPQSVQENPSSVSTKRVPMSHLFIALSDAMAASKQGQTAQAQAHLAQLQQSFAAMGEQSSAQSQAATAALAQAMAQPSAEHLAALSTALYAFEQAQNPVDYSAKRQAFKRQMLPAYEALSLSIARASPSDLSAVQDAYQQLNSAWLSNERVVRNTSMGHYGQMETAMALMRVALETTPVDLHKVQTQALKLKTALDSYNRGESAAVTDSRYDFNGGVQLLRDALRDFESAQMAQGQDKLTTFIGIWPNIEGEVSTRNPALYSRVEREVPVILAHGAQPEQQLALKNLIGELAQINPQAQYGALDSMLILLREGVEALLIVMALISSLNVAQQLQGKKWIYGGVLAGLIASVLAALALQKLFPAVSAGASRETIEGFVGIASVLMMLMVGAWLHSKSSIQSWNAYIKKHMGQALSTGSLVSLLGLSFLAVFREGAETLIFYAGILPKISTADFLLGIGLALLGLALLAGLMLKSSARLPVAKMFQVLTGLIYALGFKILGISLHALQLTGLIPMTALPTAWLESNALGIYATLETVGAQAIYLLVILAIQQNIRRSVQKSLQTA